MILDKYGRKISKSLGNVIDPDPLIEKYGADALRLYEVFVGPIDQTTSFNTDGVRAMKK
jgi:leucyl-tRNA synthetase